MLPEDYMGKDILITDDGDINFNSNNDFQFISGYPNLRQAIYNRLVTAVGTFLAHPNYGSNINSILGLRNDIFTYGLLRKEIYKTLLQEPRINDIGDIVITQITPTKIRFDLKVTPISSNEPLNLVYDYWITGD